MPLRKKTKRAIKLCDLLNVTLLNNNIIKNILSANTINVLGSTVTYDSYIALIIFQLTVIYRL